MGNSGHQFSKFCLKIQRNLFLLKELNIASLSELTAKEMKLCGSMWNKESEECAMQSQMEVEGKERGRTL
jgi:hypothetical protein